jgi:hypothetical protein
MNRRTKKYLIIGIVEAVILLSCVASAFSGDGQSVPPLLIVFLVIGILINAIYIFFHTPFMKGKVGEKVTSWRLKQAKCQKSIVIDNVIIPGDNNRTSQIDHILVSTKGIFVVETKNFVGKVYGREEDQEWLQVLKHGQVKNKFYSPVKQNLTHVYRLKELLGYDGRINSCVVFVQADIDDVKATVYTPWSLKEAINKDKEGVLSSEQVDAYAKKIQEFKDKPIQTGRQHVQQIKTTQKTIESGICPRCGGKLVLRHSKDGTRAFYGCSNYPKCTFTKNAGQNW